MLLTRLTIAALSAGMVLAWIGLGDPPAMAAGDTRTGPAGTAPPTYVGTKKCRMCHTDHADALQASLKAGAWDALAPGQAVDIKLRAGLSATMDYRVTDACLACHAVGHGRPGGYAVPPAGDGRAGRRAAQLQGVGCESCHGPGSAYVLVMSDILKRRRSYEPHEVTAAGRRPVTQATCQSCHNATAPCMVNAPTSTWLTVDLDDHHAFHPAFPLKYRRDAGDAPPDNATGATPPHRQRH